MTPRVRVGVHSLIALMLPGQPVDWAKPFTIIAATNSGHALERPYATQAAADTSIPAPMSFFAPTRSPRLPEIHCPAA